MRDTMNFRRGILAMEWEHMKMKMQIGDLEEHLNDIRAIKVDHFYVILLSNRYHFPLPFR